MNKVVCAFSCAAAVFAASAAWAQEEEADAESAEAAESGQSADQPAEGAGAAKGVSSDRLYHIMPLCRMLEGDGEVQRPGCDWQPVEEGRFYPLGCSYRTRGAASRLVVQFGAECEVDVVGEASFGTFPQKLGDKTRTIALLSGTIDVKLPRKMPEGMFTVTAPGFTVENLAGESRYTYERTGDGDEAVVRCVTGALSVRGRHFGIPAMRAANEVKIRTSQDLLFTGIYGTSGDCVAKLDQGLVSVKDFETGEEKQEEKTLDWRLTPQTAVRIHRAVPSIGTRMSVTVMTFDASGALRNRCAFAEGRSEINTGEQGVAVLEERDENLAKKAAEASDTEVAEAEETEESSEEASSDSSDSSDDGDSF